MGRSSIIRRKIWGKSTHQANDRAVLAAYGFPRDLPEEEIVARLFERLRELGG